MLSLLEVTKKLTSHKGGTLPWDPVINVANWIYPVIYRTVDLGGLFLLGHGAHKFLAGVVTITSSSQTMLAAKGAGSYCQFLALTKRVLSL
jgi:hypothetical protein